MYSKSAKYYDNIYAASGKDYHAETKTILKFIDKYKLTNGNRLLDVGCGTGVHAGLLGKQYQVEGLDIDPTMLVVARKKHPHLRFSQGDMVDFKLSRKFDVITSLFSAIGYVKTKARLQKTIMNMAQHLLPGGVVLVEPWFTPDQWNSGRVFVLQVETPEAKIVRMSHSSQKGRLSFIEFKYLIGTSKGIETDREILELGLFTEEEYLNAFQQAGLKVVHNKKGVDGRGLYIGVKPLD